MNWWAFSRMRSTDGERQWLCRSELVAALQELGVRLTEMQLRSAINAAPAAEFRHGMRRYTAEHVEAIRAYAEARGLVCREATR